jgi:hypothetical protein
MEPAFLHHSIPRRKPPKRLVPNGHDVYMSVEDKCPALFMTAPTPPPDYIQALAKTYFVVTKCRMCF